MSLFQYVAYNEKKTHKNPFYSTLSRISITDKTYKIMTFFQLISNLKGYVISIKHVVNRIGYKILIN